MIQYIVAAGVGALLGNRSRKSKMAYGGLLPPETVREEMDEYIELQTDPDENISYEVFENMNGSFTWQVRVNDEITDEGVEETMEKAEMACYDALTEGKYDKYDFARGGQVSVEGNPYKGEDFFIYLDGDEAVSYNADEIAEDEEVEELAQELYDLSQSNPSELKMRLQTLYAKGGQTGMSQLKAAELFEMQMTSVSKALDRADLELSRTGDFGNAFSAVAQARDHAMYMRRFATFMGAPRSLKGLIDALRDNLDQLQRDIKVGLKVEGYNTERPLVGISAAQRRLANIQALFMETTQEALRNEDN